MFSAATNTNKFCIATGGPVLAGGEHVTGGLVAARCPSKNSSTVSVLILYRNSTEWAFQFPSSTGSVPFSTGRELERVPD